MSRVAGCEPAGEILSERSEPKDPTCAELELPLELPPRPVLTFVWHRHSCLCRFYRRNFYTPVCIAVAFNAILKVPCGTLNTSDALHCPYTSATRHPEVERSSHTVLPCILREIEGSAPLPSRATRTFAQTIGICRTTFIRFVWHNFESLERSVLASRRDLPHSRPRAAGRLIIAGYVSEANNAGVPGPRRFCVGWGGRRAEE